MRLATLLFVSGAAWACGHGTAASSAGDSRVAEPGAAESGVIDGPSPANPATSTVDSSAGDADGDADAAPPYATASGCPLPGLGWTRKVSDHFGTSGNVATYADLHAKYYEAQFYNRGANGLVRIPNVTINQEQQTYSHFEDVIAFYADHLTIQGRGHPDGAITSGEMVSVYTARSLCVEGRYQIPSAEKSWPALWLYGSTSDDDSSEIDIEQPITQNQGVHDVSMYNHPPSTTDGGFPGNVTIIDPQFTTADMTWHDPSFDGSAAAHTYTTCYDDMSATITRCIDGDVIYQAAWKWNASLGGTGVGSDACTTFNLAVGGDWPGDVTKASAYSGDLVLYSLDYYGP